MNPKNKKLFVLWCIVHHNHHQLDFFLNTASQTIRSNAPCVTAVSGLEAKGESQCVCHSDSGVGARIFFPSLKCPHSHFNVSLYF